MIPFSLMEIVVVLFSFITMIGCILLECVFAKQIIKVKDDDSREKSIVCILVAVGAHMIAGLVFFMQLDTMLWELGFTP